MFERNPPEGNLYENCPINKGIRELCRGCLGDGRGRYRKSNDNEDEDDDMNEMMMGLDDIGEAKSNLGESGAYDLALSEDQPIEMKELKITPLPEKESEHDETPRQDVVKDSKEATEPQILPPPPPQRRPPVTADEVDYTVDVIQAINAGGWERVGPSATDLKVNR